MSWASTVNDTLKTGTTDGSQSDTQTAFNYVDAKNEDGWIIYLPTGSYSWGSACNFANTMVHSVKVQGIGGNGNRTTINGGFSGGQLIGLRVTVNKITECRYIDFNGGNNTYSDGMMAIDQTGTTSVVNGYWIEYCSFTNYQGLGMQILTPDVAAGAVFGLVNNCDFAVSGGNSGVYVNCGNNANQWNLDMTLGTIYTCCFENCTWSHTGTITPGNPAIDSRYNGAKWLMRYCTLTDWPLVAHGADSAPTGTLQVEMYWNTHTVTGACDFFMYHRGGVLIAHDNTVTVTGGGSYNSAFKMANDNCPATVSGGYPYFQQPGQGSSAAASTKTCTSFLGGTGKQLTVGCYIWNTTQSGVTSLVTTQTNISGRGSPDIDLNRDYFLAAPNGSTPLTSYTDLQYPHPLRGGGATYAQGMSGTARMSGACKFG